MSVVVLVEQLTLLRVGLECIGKSSTLRQDEKSTLMREHQRLVSLIA
jgi:hypothetical protein